MERAVAGKRNMHLLTKPCWLDDWASEVSDLPGATQRPCFAVLPSASPPQIHPCTHPALCCFGATSPLMVLPCCLLPLTSLFWLPQPRAALLLLLLPSAAPCR